MIVSPAIRILHELDSHFVATSRNTARGYLRRLNPATVPATADVEKLAAVMRTLARVHMASVLAKLTIGISASMREDLEGSAKSAPRRTE